MRKQGKPDWTISRRWIQRSGAWPRVVPSWLQSGKRAGSGLVHGVIADSGKPLPRPKAGWDQVPTPPLFLRIPRLLQGPTAWGTPAAAQ